MGYRNDLGIATPVCGLVRNDIRLYDSIPNAKSDLIRPPGTFSSQEKAGVRIATPACALVRNDMRYIEPAGYLV